MKRPIKSKKSSTPKMSMVKSRKPIPAKVGAKVTNTGKKRINDGMAKYNTSKYAK